MPSILFPSSEPVLSLAFYEALSISAQETPEGVFDDIIKASFDRIDTAYDKDQLPAIRERLTQEAEKEPPAPQARSASKKKAFGTGFLEWAAAFDSTQLCLFLADYDFDQATHLYTQIDRKVIEKLVEERLAMEWQKSVLLYEASMFGMGGHYKDSSPDDQIIDLTNDPIPRGLLKNLGVMH